ncbi:MAG: hypothetical protein AAF583_16575 [Pseudomonadota bacterium]
MRSMVIGLVVSLGTVAPAVSEEQDLSGLFECTETYRDRARLRCYDEAVGALYDQEFPPPPEVEDTTADQVSSANSDAPQQNVLPTATDARVEPGRFIQRVTRFGYDSNDKIIVWLENGDIWKQSDDAYLRRQTRDGVAEAELRRGLFGSTWIELDGGSAFKARRLDQE